MSERYRRKPNVIEVVRWTGDNLADLADFLDASPPAAGDRALYTREGPAFSSAGDDALLWVSKSQAWCAVHVGDAIAREPDGSGFYPIAADRLAEDFDPEPSPATT